MNEELFFEAQETIKNFYYARLNEDGVCTCVGEYPCECEGEEYIRLDEVNPALLGCKYDNGVWNEPEKKEEEPYINENEIIQAEMLLNQMAIMEKQVEQDEVLAEILLNQMEG